MPIISQNLSQPSESKVFTVSMLNKTCKNLLETKIGLITIEGEISNLIQASSGHYYFKLKDEHAHIQCAFFKTKAKKSVLIPENGLHVQMKALVSLYEARGDYQLIVESITPLGVGQLQLQFEALKKKLNAQGLFDEAHKQPIPSLPHTIGVITSEKGAALRDIISTLRRRFKAIQIILYPADVQGPLAAPKLCQQLVRANERNECDVLILARGGGSMEDLWAFNDEKLALEIYKSKIPLITGIGHEIDFTIADFCADLRAPTPSAAAECASPLDTNYIEELSAIYAFLQHLMKGQLSALTTTLTHLSSKLKAPLQIVFQHHQHIDRLEERMRFLLTANMQKYAHQIEQLRGVLLANRPIEKLNKQSQYVQVLQQKMLEHIRQMLTTHQLKLAKLSTFLQAASPLATLDRGYALALTKKNTLITSSHDINIGDNFWVKLKNGTLLCELIDNE